MNRKHTNDKMNLQKKITPMSNFEENGHLSVLTTKQKIIITIIKYFFKDAPPFW